MFYNKNKKGIEGDYMSKLKIYTVSSMSKVYEGNSPKFFKNRASVLIGEKHTLQIIIETDEDIKGVEMAVKSDSSVAAELFSVTELFASKEYGEGHDDYVLTSKDGMYPELLKETSVFDLRKGVFNTVFVSLSASAAGEKNVAFELKKNGVAIGSCEYSLHVVNVKLPETDLIITHWFHCDCIAELHGVEIFSEKYYEILKNYVADYVEMGNNTLLVPAITPALDTEIGHERMTAQLVKLRRRGENYEFDFSELDKFIDFADGLGIKYFEFAHLFTQWGAKFCPKIIAEENGETKRIFGWDVKSDSIEYKNFLRAYLPALKNYIYEKGLEKRSFIHISDEPNKDNLDNYIKAYNFVKPLIGDLPTFDALSEYELYEKKVVDLPVVMTSHSKSFIDNGVNHLVYYCCYPCENYEANRFFAMPPERTRILGVQLYENGAKGFLQWGYNFWYTRHSLGVLNPFKDTSANGHYASGDAFIVYPFVEGKKPYKSIRWYYVAECFQDYRALKCLEKLKGKDFVLEILRGYGIKGYSVYPRSPEMLVNLREKVNGEIEKFAANK